MKIIGLANNYINMPPGPIVFWKGDENTLAQPCSEIVIPKNRIEAWPEVELALIKVESGFSFAVANDITTRNKKEDDVHSPLFKSFNNFCPVSQQRRPSHLLTARMRTYVNGNVIQEDYIKNMRMPVHKVIDEIESQLNLDIGDIIITGTPPHSYFNLQDGDIVTVEIEEIGFVTNRIRRE